MEQNKTGKYLKYAIGEIALVVIGILIALQINTWNQNKIKTKKEIFHLENIVRNLQDDLEIEILPCIELIENQIRAYHLLQTNFYEENKISNDSINSLFFQNLSTWDLVLNTVAFDNLKSIGMDIISNDSLKSKILTLYGYDYKYLIRAEIRNKKFHYDGVTTILQDNVNIWDGITDEEKEFLKKDKRLITRMKTEEFQFRNFIIQLSNIEPKVNNLIKGVKNEIKRLKGK